MTERTEHGGASRAEHADLLDFPGAAQLITAGDVPPPRPGAVAAAQAAVAFAAQEARETRETRETRERTRSVPRRRRLLVATAAVAAIAAGAVAYPVLDLGGKPAATASASAGRFLDDMAGVAAEAPASDAQYWKVRVETDNQDDGKRTFTTYYARSGGPGEVKKWPVGEEWLTWPQLDELPTDEKALAALFPKDAESRSEQILIMLEDSPASPRLRAALFRILADTPGIELIGEVKDSKGRPGVAVEMTREARYSTGPGEDVTYWTKDRYVVDPGTGLLLENTHRIRGQSTPADRYTWLEVGPADKPTGKSANKSADKKR
ncbi:hypothetical protein GKQ77_00020 [Streptomyces sp. BG9H]|uniref:CU044_5270 family protein n=1 Tax=Streptomyces anatolicus TaxID=2675858 RepID=A0ABS6YEZ2_9ACTN|nr:hypothetical protein [Streptomyces anatolicus]MBW5419977.1 hypothetical protein [Streptomyces anatolicus]